MLFFFYKVIKIKIYSKILLQEFKLQYTFNLLELENYKTHLNTKLSLCSIILKLKKKILTTVVSFLLRSD